jgi:hypothetical protein
MELRRSTVQVKDFSQTDMARNSVFKRRCKELRSQNYRGFVGVGLRAEKSRQVNITEEKKQNKTQVNGGLCMDIRVWWQHVLDQHRQNRCVLWVLKLTC